MGVWKIHARPLHAAPAFALLWCERGLSTGSARVDAGRRLCRPVLVPVVGAVRAGYNAFAFEEHLGSEPAGIRSPEGYFYLVVRGDSMEPYIHDGDLALVRRQQTLEDGDVGVMVYRDGEGTLKRFRRQSGGVALEPFNPAYETLVLAGEQLEQLYIIGRVVETKTRW